MAYETRRQGGCGCCGTLGCAGALLLVVFLGVAVFLGVRIAWNLYAMASDQPLPVTHSTGSPAAYSQARGKLNNFMSHAEIRSVSLSEPEVNTMLADAPELGFLQNGASVLLRDNEGELRLRVPFHPIPFSMKYLNYEVFFRPIISDEKISVNVLRVTSGGKPLDPTALRAFKDQAEPFLNQLLTGLNEIQQSRAIQSVRVQNGSLLLER
jgi:hypothetical protein